MANNKYVDQSTFTEHQGVMQPPPEELEKFNLSEEEKLAVDKKKKKIRFLIIGGVAFFLLLITLMVVAKNVKPAPKTIAPTPTPSPTPKPSLLDEKLDNLSEIVKKSNPANEFLIYPPVDMEVTF